MKWSYRVAQVAGIDIKVHTTFFLVVAFFGWTWSFQHGLPGFFFGSFLILALFLCVTLHELGHSLAARAFGIHVREIVLLPLGGIAFLGRNPSKPLQELIIAVAGPLVNVAIALLLIPAILLTGSLNMLDGSAMVQGTSASISLATMLIWLLEANIFLVLFNLIPAFPLDGGRILRAVLAMFLGFRRATRVATKVGQTFAILMGLFALFTLDVFLGLIAVFIYFAAGQENVQEEASTVLSTRRVGDAYNKHVLTLAIGDRLHKVIDYVLTSYQPDFAVLQGNRLLGIITRDDALRVLASSPVDSNILDMYITAIMRRDVIRVSAEQSLEEVRKTMTEQNVRVVAVYQDDAYLGLINMDDIAEAFTVLTFIERYEQTNPRSDVSNISGETTPG